MPKPIREYRRVVSLTAALTETLFAIGAGNRVVGVTDTCDFPEEAGQKPNVSCWFEPDMDKLLALKPDLVLGLETAHAGLKPTLTGQGIDLILTNPATVEASLVVITMLGQKLQVAEHSRACIENLQERLAQLDAKVGQIPADRRMRVSRVLDIEDDQMIVAGPLSFQYDVIARAGGLNVTGETGEAYPKVSVDRFREWDPEMIFFCGYDNSFVTRFCAAEKWRSLRAVQSGRVYQFDCALTCRTGPRIVDMAELLFETLYADTLNC
jgi:ABC-type Fe3+-hydroxamate transport system substrate-binding protein